MEKCTYFLRVKDNSKIKIMGNEFISFKYPKAN
jgi:hypothetical protein